MKYVLESCTATNYYRFIDVKNIYSVFLSGKGMLQSSCIKYDPIL